MTAHSSCVDICPIRPAVCQSRLNCHAVLLVLSSILDLWHQWEQVHVRTEHPLYKGESQTQVRTGFKHEKMVKISIAVM